MIYTCRGQEESVDLLATDLTHWMSTKVDKHFCICRKRFLIFFLLSLSRDFHRENQSKQLNRCGKDDPGIITLCALERVNTAVERIDILSPQTRQCQPPPSPRTGRFLPSCSVVSGS